MINLQPKLFGKLINLRPLRPQDFYHLSKISSDKLIWQQHPDKRRIQPQYFRQKFFQPALQWQSCLVIQTPNNQIKGCSRYYIHRPEHKDIAIGYTFISRDCWGTNVNKQLKYLMMRHIYNWVDIIYFNIGKDNHRSRMAVSKLGTTLLSQQRINQKKLEMPKETVTFQIDRSTFERSRYFDEVKQKSK